MDSQIAPQPTISVTHSPFRVSCGRPGCTCDLNPAVIKLGMPGWEIKDCRFRLSRYEREAREANGWQR